MRKVDFFVVHVAKLFGEKKIKKLNVGAAAYVLVYLWWVVTRPLNRLLLVNVNSVIRHLDFRGERSKN